MIAGEKKSPGHVGRLPLGALRTGYLLATSSWTLFRPSRVQELSLHAIVDRVSTARPQLLLPVHPGHSPHRCTRTRRHHCRARLAHALSRPGCRILAANAFKTGCGANERTEPWVARERGVSSVFGASARKHVHLSE